MFNNSPFGQNPLQPTVDIQTAIRYQQQLQGQQQKTVIDEVQEKLQAIPVDDREYLFKDEQFLYAKQIYEASFQDFLASKFKQEFASTQTGNKAATELLNAITASAQRIEADRKSEREKLAKLSKLLEQNPKLLEQLENESK